MILLLALPNALHSLLPNITIASLLYNIVYLLVLLTLLTNHPHSCIGCENLNPTLTYSPASSGNNSCFQNNETTNQGSVSRSVQNGVVSGFIPRFNTAMFVRRTKVVCSFICVVAGQAHHCKSTYFL
jgi:hypothetical protein